MTFATTIKAMTLTAFCAGCTTLSATESYGVPPSDAAAGEVSQGVGFGSTGGTLGAPEATEPAVESEIAPSNEAIIALIGLVALIAIADDVQACSGIGCEDGDGGGGFRLE